MVANCLQIVASWRRLQICRKFDIGRNFAPWKTDRISKTLQVNNENFRPFFDGKLFCHPPTRFAFFTFWLLTPIKDLGNGSLYHIIKTDLITLITFIVNMTRKFIDRSPLCLCGHRKGPADWLRRGKYHIFVLVLNYVAVLCRLRFLSSLLLIEFLGNFYHLRLFWCSNIKLHLMLYAPTRMTLNK